MQGKVSIIGFGPGGMDHVTPKAKEAIIESDCVLGYKTYIKLVTPLLHDGQEVVSAGMTEEVERAHSAVRIAEEGKSVAVISSGDAGVYGMAGLVYEVLAQKGWSRETGIAVEVVPGISAINACASLLGAPVMHDACTISLSDHLTPWEVIEKRLDAAGSADFVVALYNPKSGRRTQQIVKARDILLQYRSKDTPVGLVKSAYRERQHLVMTTLDDMLNHDIGMLTTVIIGNSTTFIHDGLMITPRGYERKYSLADEKQKLKMNERLQEKNEPWALHGGGAAPKETNKKAVTDSEVFEASPGLIEKTFSKRQMMALAQAADHAEVRYSKNHAVRITPKQEHRDETIRILEEAGLSLTPTGSVCIVKACDFCDGEKEGGIPFVKQIQQRFGGMKLPRLLKIGFNGCALACYGALHEDIAVVYRRGTFDLFVGGRPNGRKAHAAILVEEKIEFEQLMSSLEKVLDDYREHGEESERLWKYIERTGQVGGYILKNEMQTT